MKRIGIDLGVLQGGDELRTPFVHPDCPGARVYVTREMLKAYVSGGEEFIADETHVPPVGYGVARVRCGRPVASKVGCAGHVVYYGLCPSCAGVEQDNRAVLRKRGEPQ